jgi:hypothetical protein
VVTEEAGNARYLITLNELSAEYLLKHIVVGSYLPVTVRDKIQVWSYRRSVP